MKNKLFQLALKGLSGAALLGPAFAHGQPAPDLPNVDPKLTTPDGVIKFLCDIAGWIFAFLIVLAIIFILVAAFRYLTARGDAEKVTAANQALLFSAVAVAVAVVAKAIPLVIGGFLGAGDVGPSC